MKAAQFVKDRDVVCQKCHQFRPLEQSHVYPRRFTKLVDLPENILGLCAEDHRWWHAHPKLAKRWFIQTFPERYELLKVLAGVGLKV